MPTRGGHSKYSPFGHDLLAHAEFTKVGPIRYSVYVNYDKYGRSAEAEAASLASRDAPTVSRSFRPSMGTQLTYVKPDFNRNTRRIHPTRATQTTDTTLRTHFELSGNTSTR